jgi:hypothetical protein
MHSTHHHLVVAVAVAVFATVALARPTTPAKLPNGMASSDPSSGLKCLALGHDKCVPGATRNTFGLDFKAAGLAWNTEFCMKDSDGDGLTNGEELGDPCCLWTPENKSPVGFRTTMLSHPGDAAETGASAAPKVVCPVKASSPTTGPTSTSAMSSTTAKEMDTTATTVMDSTTAKMTTAMDSTTPVMTTVMDSTTTMMTTVMDSTTTGMMNVTTSKPSSCARNTTGKCAKKPVTELMALLVAAGTNGRRGRKLANGTTICPSDYGYTGFSIVALMPYTPKDVTFYVDGKLTWRESLVPYSIAGNTPKKLVKPWKTYPAEGKQFVLKIETDKGEKCLNVVIKCGDSTVSPTSGTPTTTMVVNSYTTA